MLYFANVIDGRNLFFYRNLPYKPGEMFLNCFFSTIVDLDF